MVFCEHCEITLVRQSHQQKDCGFDTRFLGGPGPFFSGPWCCNCAKADHGWSNALYSTYACSQCKARAKDTGKRRSDEKAISEEEAQWEAYFLKQAHEGTTAAEAGKPCTADEELPNGPAMVQRQIMAPPISSMPKFNSQAIMQGTPRLQQTALPDETTPRGYSEANLMARRGEINTASERRDTETRKGYERDADWGAGDDGRKVEDWRESEWRDRHPRNSPHRRDTEREKNYLSKEALQKLVRSTEQRDSRDREWERDVRGGGLESYTPREPRERETNRRHHTDSRQRSMARAVETSVFVRDGGIPTVQQVEAEKVSLEQRTVFENRKLILSVQVIADAEREAQKVIAEARRQASRIIDDARSQAEDQLAQVDERMEGVRDSEEAVGALARRTISVFFYGELAAATGNFSESTRIGGGGFGSVFKMDSLEGLGHTNRMAVKRLDPSSMQGQTEFLQEVQVLGGCRHENLLPLIGFSTDVGSLHPPRRLNPEEPHKKAVGAVCLVLPLMKGGSLEDRLTPEHPASARRLKMLSGGWLGAGPPPLTWQERLHALVCVSRALDYLHTPDEVVHKPVILHRDIKPANILLDADMHARLADVGLARMQMNNMTHVSFTQLAGTKGFLDPNYMQTGHFDASADGYALGVTILMCLTGWPAFDGGETIIDRCFNRKARDVADVRAGWPRDKAKAVLKIALELVAMPRRSRTMTVADARAALEALEDPVDAMEEVLERECIICLSMPRQVRFPCGHSALCQGCYQQFLKRPKAKCPHCRQTLKERDFRTITSDEVASQHTFVRPLGGGERGGGGHTGRHHGGEGR